MDIHGSPWISMEVFDHFGVTLGSLWGHFGVTSKYWYIRVALDHLWVTLGPFRAYDRYMRGLGGAKKRKCLFYTGFCMFF